MEVVGDKRINKRIDVDEAERREKETEKNKSGCKWCPEIFSQSPKKSEQ